MKERYRWSIYGFLAGSFFSFTQVFMIYKRLGISDAVNPLAVWERPVGPIVLSIASFFIGWSRDRLIKQRQDTEQKNKDLQKAMIEQSMQLGKELNSTMNELNRYTDQLDKIINNIDAGVCLINRDYKIEEGFNNALIRIFGHKDYLKNSIFNTIFSMIDDNLKKETTDFLEQCFLNVSASDSMLSDANPMEEFEYLYLDKGSAVPKTIVARIVRLKDINKDVEKILFLFDDVTVKRELEKSIKQKEEEYNKKYSIIVSLLGNDREVTRQFIRDLNSDMKNLGESIKKLKQNEKNIEIIDNIIGMVHSIKGEAFSLDFKTLAEEASRFESFLKEKKRNILDLEMNLEIVNFFEKISNERAAFEKMIEDLTVFIYGEGEENRELKESANTKSAIKENVRKHLDQEKRPFSLLYKELQIVKDKTAEEKGKMAVLNFDSEIDEIDAATYKLLKDVLLHLVRNSIDHGIESPEVRKDSGKHETGSITITVKKTEDGISLEYTDDGNGFDIERIKEKAVEKNLVKKETIDKMNNMDIIKLIFRDGFSTNDDVDMISGMGAGMSVVRKNIISQLKGKLSIVNKADRGILLKMSIPC